MRVVIADDEAPARDKLRRWLAAEPDVEIVAEAADGIVAARAIGANAVDVVFLDIQMPELTGLEVAAQLQSTTAPLIVFVTAHADHALRAFELNALDYLLKPYDRDRLLLTLDRVRSRLGNPQMSARAVAVAREQSGGSDRLLVPDGEKLTLIETRTIAWLEADDNYVTLHAGTRTYHLRRTLHDLLLQLGAGQFVRVHKSAAVNLAEVAALHPLFKGDYEIELRNGERVRLSRRYRETAFERMRR